MWLRIVSLKNCIILILMQKRNKLLNNIAIYPYNNRYLEKIGPIKSLQLMAHQTPIF